MKLSLNFFTLMSLSLILSSVHGEEPKRNFSMYDLQPSENYKSGQTYQTSGNQAAAALNESMHVVTDTAKKGVTTVGKGVTSTAHGVANGVTQGVSAVASGVSQAALNITSTFKGNCENLKVRSICYSDKPWKPEYTKYISDILDNPKYSTHDLVDKKLPTGAINDMNTLGCRHYEHVDREEKKKFWILILSSMAFAESDYVKNKSFRINKGLLQLSTSAKLHGGPCKGGSNWFDPKLNLQCGAHILRNQMFMSRAPKRILTPKFYRWEVLKPGANRYNVFKKAFNKDKHQLAACQ